MDETASSVALFAWLSPAFPIGSFAYSHGLESAIEDGHVSNAATLEAWLVDLIGQGSIRNDAILAHAAWQAHDAAGFAEVNDLALALCASRERRLETTAQGNAFVAAIRAAWPVAGFRHWPEGDIAYPTAFGSACAAAEMPWRPALEAFILAVAQSLISAAVRLGAVGQTDGQRVTAALLPAVGCLAEAAMLSSLDDVGGCAHYSDIAAMRHETLYSRLFRS